MTGQRLVRYLAMWVAWLPGWWSGLHAQDPPTPRTPIREPGVAALAPPSSPWGQEPQAPPLPHWVVPAAVGFAAGALVGLVVGAIVCPEEEPRGIIDNRPEDNARGVCLVALAAPIGVVGAVVGYHIGTRRLRAEVVLAPRAAGLRIRYRPR